MNSVFNRTEENMKLVAEPPGDSVQQTKELFVLFPFRYE